MVEGATVCIAELLEEGDGGAWSVGSVFLYFLESLCEQSCTDIYLIHLIILTAAPLGLLQGEDYKKKCDCT